MSIPRVLFGFLLLCFGAAALLTVADGGIDRFYASDDPVFFRAVAGDPLGDGAAFDALGRPEEASYRYGRIGLPALGWLVALGHPPWLDASLVLVNLLALAAVPALVAALLASDGVEPARAAAVVVLPSLLVLVTRVYAEPLMVAAVLVGLLLAERRRHLAAAGALAFAVLCKETAILAVVPLVARAARSHDRRPMLVAVASLVPYAAWTAWIAQRVGEVPILADTSSRRDALGLPLVGLAHVWEARSAERVTVVLLVVVSAVAGAAAGVVGRRQLVGVAAALFAALALCLGDGTLLHLGETLRLLLPVQVLAAAVLLAAVGPIAGPTRGAAQVDAPRADHRSVGH
jgi:hypothetical protein